MYSKDPTRNSYVRDDRLLIDQVMELLRSVRGRNIIGGDVVCLIPTKDSPNKITSMVAMSIMFEIISLIADNKK